MKDKLKFLLKYFEVIIASGFILFTTVLVIMNVFLRYFLNTGIVWSEEVATGCFVWSVFVGSAAAYRNGALLGVDILVNRLPGILSKLITFLVKVILVIVNVVLTWLSCVYVSLSYTKPTPVLGVSSAWISSSLIVCFGLTSIYSLINLGQYVKSIIKDKEA